MAVVMLGEMCSSLKVMSLALKSAGDPDAPILLREGAMIGDIPLSEEIHTMKTRETIKSLRPLPKPKGTRAKTSHGAKKKYNQFGTQTTLVIKTRKAEVHVRVFRNGMIGIPRGHDCDDEEMALAIEILLRNINTHMHMDLAIDETRTTTSLENYVSKIQNTNLRIWLPTLREKIETMEHMTQEMQEGFVGTNQNIERRCSVCVKFIKRPAPGLLQPKKKTHTTIDIFTSGKINFTNVASHQDAMIYYNYMQTLLQAYEDEVIYSPNLHVPSHDNSSDSDYNSPLQTIVLIPA
jgi:TATA-box binding protein (TBP) (component of TFIID and TFIIIB)